VEKRHVLRILDRSGDTEVAWKPGVKTEEDVAEAEFDRLTKQGYLMFSVAAPGAKPEQIRGFVSEAPEILALSPFKGG
jgi:hypothetical protein